MIKIICDKCGQDCGLNAFLLTIETVNNPGPTHPFDSSELQITCDNRKVKAMLCQKCYRAHGLPNVHSCYRNKELVWRDELMEE